MIPNDLFQASLLSALDGARIVYFDGRLHETASIVAQEVNILPRDQMTFEFLHS